MNDVWTKEVLPEKRIPQRSNTGCWTCRLRRKKCDEKGMPCLSCSSLRLLCYGYGPRPDWFDGGQQEKAQAAAFKAIVRRTSLAKRRDRWQENSLANVEKCTLGPGSPLREISNVHSQQQQSNDPDPFGHSIAGSTTSSSPNEMSGDLEKAFQMLESVQDLHHETLEFDDVNLCLDATEYHDTAAESSGESSTDIIPMAAATAKVSLSNDFHLEFFPNCIECVPHETQQTTAGAHFGVQASSLMISPSTASESSLSLSRQRFLTPVTAGAPNGFPMLSGQEQSALQYYTEVVFPSLFSFLSFDVARDECKKTIESSRQLRVCLQYVISHSARHQDAELRRFGLRLPEPTVAHGATVLDQHIQRPAGAGTYQESTVPTILSTGSVDKECLLHVLLAQVNQSNKDWPDLLELLSCNASVSNLQDPNSYFSCEVLSYMEILASTLTGTEPRFANQYLSAHNNQSVVGFVTGVEFWLLNCLIRIVQLRSWKEHEYSKGSLSMKELVTRSLPIEHDLQRRRQESQQHRDGNDAARYAFMQVYASAAAVFLQCTVSDARPAIAEIQKEVSNTIQALRCLPQASLLKRLAWPVCIAASMTTDVSQQAFFRSLSQRVVEAWGSAENISCALDVAFECWRLHGSAAHGETYDWTDAMKSRGHLLLLF